jgi:hypothetical protein
MNKWTNDLMGKWVTITKRLNRSSGSIGSGNVRVKWYSMGTDGAGMIIGRRWLSNGDITQPYADEPRIFTRTGTVPCIVVVRSDRENPIYVPLDGFEVNQ